MTRQIQLTMYIRWTRFVFLEWEGISRCNNHAFNEAINIINKAVRDIKNAWKVRWESCDPNLQIASWNIKLKSSSANLCVYLVLSHLVPNKDRIVLAYAMNGRRVSTLITDCVSIREITFRILMIELSEISSLLAQYSIEAFRKGCVSAVTMFVYSSTSRQLHLRWDKVTFEELEGHSAKNVW